MTTKHGNLVTAGVVLIICFVGLVLGGVAYLLRDTITRPILPPEPQIAKPTVTAAERKHLSAYFIKHHYRGVGAVYSPTVIFNDIFCQLDSIKARLDSLEGKYWILWTEEEKE